MMRMFVLAMFCKVRRHFTFVRDCALRLGLGMASPQIDDEH